ncbi:MAG: DNA repair protein RecN, partial [Leucobacter sp.]
RLSTHLFAVHGQSEQLRLRSMAAQRDTLDRFGGDALAAVLTEYRAVYKERSDAEAQLAHLIESSDARAAEISQLRTELDEIASVDPTSGEEAELSSRIEVLGNVEALRAAAVHAVDALASESVSPDQQDAGALVSAAIHEIEGVATLDPRLSQALDTLRSVSFQIADVAQDLAAYASDLDDEGPGDLERANERLAALTGLFRHYGASSDAVLSYAEQASRRLLELDSDTDVLDGLDARVSSLREREADLAAKLTQLRTEEAAQLGAAVSTELRALALPDAMFVASIAPLESFGSSGGDDVHFLLAPHPGAEPRPIAKSASGGELSRVMLALEVVLAGADPVPTFVFDEVDAGVGGAAAIEIGRRLAQLARTSQVIVVTHLAQVAAFANNHLQVVKDSSGGFTESSCRRLEGDERLAEMARLLSGLDTSESALEHAAELLQLGASK